MQNDDHQDCVTASNGNDGPVVNGPSDPTGFTDECDASCQQTCCTCGVFGEMNYPGCPGISDQDGIYGTGGAGLIVIDFTAA